MDQVVLLDTHVVVWWLTDARRVSLAARRAVTAARRRCVADITLREIAALHRAGRLELSDPPREWLSAAIDQLELEVVPISPEIADRSTRIAQNFHGDPADQLIAATAIELDVPLITADDKLRSSNALRTIW